ncbi:MAG: hypothetical protein ACI4QT_06200, partial [Kiritimatiellia bacterium]
AARHCPWRLATARGGSPLPVAARHSGVDHRDYGGIRKKLFFSFVCRKSFFVRIFSGKWKARDH